MSPRVAERRLRLIAPTFPSSGGGRPLRERKEGWGGRAPGNEGCPASGHGASAPQRLIRLSALLRALHSRIIVIPRAISKILDGLGVLAGRSAAVVGMGTFATLATVSGDGGFVGRTGHAAAYPRMGPVRNAATIGPLAPPIALPSASMPGHCFAFATIRRDAAPAGQHGERSGNTSGCTTPSPIGSS